MTILNKIIDYETTFSNNINIKYVDLGYAEFNNNDMSRAFNGCTNLKSVININENITNIAYTFDWCYNLVNVPAVPNGVTNMCGTFNHCGKLKNVPVIPNGVTSIYQTFYGCSSLVNVPVIPNGVTNIVWAFAYCYNLVNAPVIPNGVTSMGSSFAGCRNLVNAPEIPNSVIDMGWTFNGCYNLVNAPEIPNSVTDMSGTFSDCYNLVNAPEIPNSVTSMARTFSFCYNLINAPEIPNSVTNMYNTFYYCKNLVNAPEIPNGVINLTSTFSGCSNLVNAPVIPDGVTDMDNTFSGCSNLVNIFRIPNSVTSMYNTFSGCTNLVNVPKIPENIFILANAFRYCTNLVYIPDINYCLNLTSVYETFYNCTNLVNAPLLPNTNTITTMTRTFGNCTNLVNAPLLPNGVTGMLGTFQYCTNLVNAPVIPESVTDMRNTFNGCTSLTGDIYIHSANINISVVSCFNGTSLEKNVYIPFTYQNGEYTQTYNKFNQYYSNHENGVTLVDLMNISDWTYITLDNGTRLLESYINQNSDIVVPFYKTIMNNGVLQSMGIINSVDLRYVPFVNDSMDNAFSACRNLTTVTNINENVTNMYRTFSNCYKLVNITIPNNVINLSYAFYMCYHWINMIIPNSVTDMGSTFAYCSDRNYNISLIHYDIPLIPSSVTNMYHTFYNFESLAGNIFIESEIVTNAMGCFYIGDWKNVYIPFTYQNGEYTETYNSFNQYYGSQQNYVNLIDLRTLSHINFNIFPERDTLKYLNGKIMNYNRYPVDANNEYILYNENCPIVIGHTNNLTPNTEYTVTKDLTSVTGYTITLNTGLTDCEVTFDINGVKIPAIANGNNYSITLNTDEDINIGYFIEKEGYKDVEGTLVFNNSNIIQNITMEVQIWASWTQPILTSNGTLGGNSFAVYSQNVYDSETTPPYYAFDNNIDTYFDCCTGIFIDGNWNNSLTIYNPNKLKITQMVFNFVVEESSSGSGHGIIIDEGDPEASNIKIRGSNDNTNWFDISSSYNLSSHIGTLTLTLSKGYKYYNLSMEGGSVITDEIKMSSITITAQEEQ